MAAAAQAVTVFFSYSHQDETFRDELAKHLSILERQSVISGWHDRKILPGEEWDHQIDENLQKADIILLLISSDFIASNYCWDVEVKISMQRHEAGNGVVIPIILRRVDWSGAVFGKLQFLPKNADPVDSWKSRDDAYHNITQGIRAVANQLIQKRQQQRITESKQAALQQYRQKVEEFAADGEISYVETVILQDLQQQLGLTDEEAEAVKKAVLEPIEQYQNNLNRYRQTFINLLQKSGNKLQTKERNELKKLQDYFKLRDEDIIKIEAELTANLQENVPSNVVSEREKTKISLPQPIQTKEIELKSERGVNYTELRDLLAAGEWKKADEETAKVMFKVANREEEGWLRVEDIDSFPCEDLGTIDRLWVHYSKGKFGFSVQKEIYQSLGGQREYNKEVWEQFGDAVGWRVKKKWIYYKDITFSLEAPQGHLPNEVRSIKLTKNCEQLLRGVFRRSYAGSGFSIPDTEKLTIIPLFL